MAMRCQHQVVIVGRTFGARSINWSLNRRRTGTIIQLIDHWRIGTISIVNSRHSGAISLSIVCGSTVLAQGQFCRRISTKSCLSSSNSSFIGCRLISTTIIGITGVLAQLFSQLDCIGNNTVTATGLFGWQCNASNGVRIL